VLIDVAKLSLHEVLHLRRQIQTVLAQKLQQRAGRVIPIESELDNAIDYTQQDMRTPSEPV